jgi:hypothetical protein
MRESGSCSGKGGRRVQQLCSQVRKRYLYYLDALCRWRPKIKIQRNHRGTLGWYSTYSAGSTGPTGSRPQ